MKSEEFDKKGVYALACAIIEKAADDYRLCLKCLSRNPNNESAKDKKESIERFFRSDFYRLLTNVDCEYLIRRLQEDAANGIFTKAASCKAIKEREKEKKKKLLERQAERKKEAEKTLKAIHKKRKEHAEKYKKAPVLIRRKRQGRTFNVNGETKTVNEVASLLGIAKSSLYKRLQRGWTVEKLLSTKRIIPGSEENE